MAKNINLTIFVVVGFLVTTVLWGFVGGCGTGNHSDNAAVPNSVDEKTSTETGNSVESSVEGTNFDKPVAPPVKAEQPVGVGPQTSQTVVETKSQSERIHVVEQGDTLWNISKKYGVTVTSIKQLNALKEDAISIGQKLKIPGGVPQNVSIPVEEKKTEAAPAVVQANTSTATPFTAEQAATVSVPAIKETKQNTASLKPGTILYTVKEGDSLWRIAQKCGTSVEELAVLNGIKKDTVLTPGKQIMVPNEKQAK